MSNLNKTWLYLIYIGIIILIGFIGFNIYQSLTGVDTEFNETVNDFSQSEIFSDEVKNHLRSAPDF